MNDVVDPPNILKQFLNIGDVMGVCKDELVKIHTDSKVKPVTPLHCGIPFHVRKKVEQRICQIED